MSLAQKSAGDVITLTGTTVFAFSFGSNATAQLFVNQDGTVDQRINNGSFTQIFASTDWVIPNGSAPGTYQTRYTNRTGDTLDAPTSALEDTWRALSLGNFSLSLVDSTPLAGGQAANFDIEIRLGTGSALASTSHGLDADREDF